MPSGGQLLKRAVLVRMAVATEYSRICSAFQQLTCLLMSVLKQSLKKLMGLTGPGQGGSKLMRS